MLVPQPTQISPDNQRTSEPGVPVRCARKIEGEVPLELMPAEVIEQPVLQSVPD